MTEADWEACESPEALLKDKYRAEGGPWQNRRLAGIACCRFAFAEAGVEDQEAHDALFAMECQALGLPYDVSRLDGASHVRDREFINRNPKPTFFSPRERAKWNALDSACILDDSFGIDLPPNVYSFFYAIRCAASYGRDPKSVLLNKAALEEYPIPEAADIVRDIIPWHVRVQTGAGLPAWRNDPTALMLAESAKSNRMRCGRIDPVTMLALADSLEEAGCDYGTLLRHLRGSQCPYCKDADFAINDIGTPVLPIISWATARNCRCNGTKVIQKPHWLGCWAIDYLLGA